MKTSKTLILKFRAPLLFACAAALALVAGVGCGTTRIRTPDGFARLRNQLPTYEQRSVSPDGVVIALRSQPNEVEGNLMFWSGAVDRTLRVEQHYQPTAAREIRTTSGLVGRRLEYTLGSGPTLHRYEITVIVTAGRVFLIEAGGNAPAFDAAREQIDRTVLSFNGT